jgi:hypothetical protein
MFLNYIVIGFVFIFYMIGLFLGQEADNTIVMLWVLMNSALLITILDKVNKLGDDK